jgi:hypothetical protein
MANDDPELLRIRAALAVRRPRRVSWLASGDRAMRVYVAGERKIQAAVAALLRLRSPRRSTAHSAGQLQRRAAAWREPAASGALAGANVQHSGESDDGILTAAEAAQLD